MNLTADELKFIEDHGSSTLSDEFYTWLVSRRARRCAEMRVHMYVRSDCRR